MPGRPRTPEDGALTEPASAPVDGHGHQFRRGVDYPAYVCFLRCFASLDPAALRASVTQREVFYGFDPQSVSIQPGGPKGSDAHPRRSRQSIVGGTVPDQIGGTGQTGAARFRGNTQRKEVQLRPLSGVNRRARCTDSPDARRDLLGSQAPSDQRDSTGPATRPAQGIESLVRGLPCG